MARKDPAATVEYLRRYYMEHKEKWKTPEARARATKRSRDRSPEERAWRWADWYARRRESVLAGQRTQFQKLKQEMIAAYGGSCSCCGEISDEFLTLDHIKRDGNTHRRSLAPTHPRGATAKQVYMDLKRHHWPREGFRLLCMNCNFATRFGATCPHVQTQVNEMLAGVLCS